MSLSLNNISSIQSFLLQNEIAVDSRLALLFFYFAKAKEYGCVTTAEMKRINQSIMNFKGDNLKSKLQSADEELEQNDLEQAELFKFGFEHMSFGKNWIDKEIFISKVISVA